MANGATAWQCLLWEVDREHSLQVLRDTAGVIGGSHGAAARLSLTRTTLRPRLARLGIARWPS